MGVPYRSSCPMGTFRVLSLTSWFKLPELGMSQFEVLSRASAFAVTLPSRPPVLLSSRHVTHPHHYLDTYYHDKEWLGAVNNRSLRYSVEAYKPGDKVPCAFVPVTSAPMSHPTRDVSCWNELVTAKIMDQLKVQGVLLHAFPLISGRCQTGQHVEFEGYVNANPVATSDAGWDGSEDSQVIPEFPSAQVHHTVHGHVLGRSPQQIFTTTDSVLEMGMCGGSVVDTNDACVGLIEGVVPPVTAADETRGAEYVKFRRAIADTAVFVEADVLIDFLKLA